MATGHIVSCAKRTILRACSLDGGGETVSSAHQTSSGHAYAGQWGAVVRVVVCQKLGGIPVQDHGGGRVHLQGAGGAGVTDRPLQHGGDSPGFFLAQGQHHNLPALQNGGDSHGDGPLRAARPVRKIAGWRRWCQGSGA